jgi:hypothetical protein
VLISDNSLIYIFSVSPQKNLSIPSLLLKKTKVVPYSAIHAIRFVVLANAIKPFVVSRSASSSHKLWLPKKRFIKTILRQRTWTTLHDHRAPAAPLPELAGPDWGLSPVCASLESRRCACSSAPHSFFHAAAVRQWPVPPPTSRSVVLDRASPRSPLLAFSPYRTRSSRPRAPPPPANPF